MATKTEARELVTKAKATPFETIEAALNRSIVGLGKALPEHMRPERLNRLVLTLLRTAPSLQNCEPMSVIAAVFQMAQLGLEPIDGQAFIIPYSNHGVLEAQFQIGFKGLVSLFYRHIASASLSWAEVKENDAFVWDLGKGSLSHTYDLKQPRGETYAYWVKARLANGAEIFAVMSKIEVAEHGKKHSKSYGKGPWQTDFDAMALKTVLIKLMKLLPKSVEFMEAISLDNTTKRQVDRDMTQVPDVTNWDEKPTIDVEPVKPEEKKPPEPPTKTAGPVNLDDYMTDSKTGKMVHKVTGQPL